MNILITAVGGDLAQSVIKCLKASVYESVLTGCDCDRYSGGQADVDRFRLAPPVNQAKEYGDFLQQLIRMEKIDYVFPLSDIEILYYHKNRKRFRDSPAKFMVQSAEILDVFMDKLKTVEFFRVNGLPFPLTWLPSDLPSEVQFPLVIKKRIGCGGKGFSPVKDRSELDFHLSRQKDVILQEYLPGEDREFTTGLFSDGRECHTITFRRKLAPGGYSRWVELTEGKEIKRFAHQIGAALNFRGSINLQFRQTDKGCIPFEINPRFSSTVYFRHLFGFKDVEWTMDLQKGRPVRYLGPTRKGVGIRRLSEILFEEEEQP